MTEFPRVHWELALEGAEDNIALTPLFARHAGIGPEEAEAGRQRAEIARERALRELYLLDYPHVQVTRDGENNFPTFLDIDDEVHFRLKCL